MPRRVFIQEVATLFQYSIHPALYTAQYANDTRSHSCTVTEMLVHSVKLYTLVRQTKNITVV